MIYTDLGSCAPSCRVNHVHGILDFLLPVDSTVVKNYNIVAGGLVDYYKFIDQGNQIRKNCENGNI